MSTFKCILLTNFTFLAKVITVESMLPVFLAGVGHLHVGRVVDGHLLRDLLVSVCRMKTDPETLALVNVVK